MKTLLTVMMLLALLALLPPLARAQDARPPWDDRRLAVVISLAVDVRNDADPTTSKYNAQGYPKPFRPNPTKGTSPSKYFQDIIGPFLNLGGEVVEIKGLAGSPDGDQWIVNGNAELNTPSEILQDLRDNFVPWWQGKLAANPHLTLVYYKGSRAPDDTANIYASKSTPPPSVLKCGTDAEKALWRLRHSVEFSLGFTRFDYDWITGGPPRLEPDLVALNTALANSDLTGDKITCGSEALALDYTEQFPQIFRRAFWTSTAPAARLARQTTFDPKRTRLQMWYHDVTNLTALNNEKANGCPVPIDDAGFKQWVRDRVAQGLCFAAQDRVPQLAAVAAEINDPDRFCLHN